jgi:hypothetical protein
MTADIAGSVFDLYALGVFAAAALMILAARLWRSRRRRAWWRSGV